MKTSTGVVAALASVAQAASAPPSSGSYRISPIDGTKIALPTKEQLDFQDREMGVLIHFNMATYITPDGCNGDPTLVPSRSLFDPEQLDTDQWMESVKAFGGKYATLVAKHNCGFTTWPSEVTFKDSNGETVAYNYTIAQSPVKGKNVIESFIESTQKYGFGHGFYYSSVWNNYLNINNGEARTEAPTSEQVGVSTETYNDVVLAQLTELWEKYGNLTEIWFDGGYSGSQKDRIHDLLEKTQPQAVIFNGCQDDGTCVSRNSIRWIGNEEAHAEVENWSSGLTGSGAADSEYFVPSECDTTLMTPHRWFWGQNWGIKTLEQLKTMYHESVGRNCIMAMDMSPDRRGLIPDNHVQRYKELGDFVRDCYGKPVRPNIQMETEDGVVRLVFARPVSIDRVQLMEDQTDGQLIRKYDVWGWNGVQWTLMSNGTSVGHKKIDLFGKTYNGIHQVIVNATQYADTPKWRSVSVHKCS